MKHHNKHFIIGNFLLATILLITIQSIPSPANAEDTYDCTFTWNFEGSLYRWDLDIPKDRYEAYQEVKLAERIKNGPEGYDYLVTTKDSYVIQMANALHDKFEELTLDTNQEINFILAFVQCLPYTYDIDSRNLDEYPRFPIESLVDGGGDCEDTSILFATLLKILNYSVVFISPPQHFAVGVKGEDDWQGSYAEYSGNRYFFCETTGEGYQVGDLPLQFWGEDVSVYPINLNNQIQLKTQIPWAIRFLVIVLVIVILSVVVVWVILRLQKRRKDTADPLRERVKWRRQRDRLIRHNSKKEKRTDFRAIDPKPARVTRGEGYEQDPVGCRICGPKISGMIFTCKYCGGRYCALHRLPENHDCDGI